MTNVTALIDRFIEATGHDPIDLRLRGRYEREAGLLPDAPKGRRAGGRLSLPLVAEVHALIVILGAHVGGSQRNVAAAIRDRAAMRLQATGPENGPFWAPPNSNEPKPCFIRVLFSMMVEATLATTPDQQAAFEKRFKRVVVQQDRMQCRIVYSAERADVFYDPLESPFTHVRAPSQKTSAFDAAQFVEMAEIVRQSRWEAARRGIEIRTQEVWEALGIEAPPDSPIPVPPPMSTITGREKTEAAEAPPSTAPENAQPATKSPDTPSNSVDATLSHTRDATPSQVGRLHPHAGRGDHAVSRQRTPDAAAA